MANWSQLLPASEGPPEVEAARRKVAELRERIPAQREAVAAAQRAVVEAEVSDRERMARELAQGDSPTADARSVQKAEEHAASVRRQAQALDLAVATAETALGQSVHDQRDRWLTAAAREEKAARARARKVIEGLHNALDGVANAAATTHWLQHGVEREAQAVGVGLGGLTGAPSSAFQAANSSAVPVPDLLRWLSEIVGDPPGEARGPEREPAPAATAG